MLTLYYSPDACSMASHITLEESGAAYEAKPVMLAQGEHRREAYLKINPRGKVPALVVDGAVLTENVAILTYVARTNPAAKLLPSEPFAEARCLSAMAWLSNTVHPCFTRFNRPERFTADEAGQAAVKASGRQAFWAALQEIDGLMAGKRWFQGDDFTASDPYALVFYGWGRRIDLPMAELAHYTAWKDRMLTRPAVRRILERERSVLLQPA